MTNPAFAHGRPDDADGLRAHVAAVRSRVRRDLRATSFPLLLLGAAIIVGELPQVVSQRWNIGGPIGVIGGGDWFTGLLLAAAFVVLWWRYWRRARRDGVGRPEGFAAATGVGLGMVQPTGLVLLPFVGPFALFGAGLLMVAAWQRNARLAWWAVLAGGVGVFEGFFGITNRLPLSAWHSWDHPAIYLALGVLTLLAGLATRIRENRAQ